jgi:hypothetical protein
MNDTNTLPSVLVVSTTTRDSDLLSRSAPIIRKQTEHGAMAVSCHWGSPQIRVAVSEQRSRARSVELAASATHLLHAAGLTQPDDRSDQEVFHHRFDSTDSIDPPPMIHVSVPGNFGVELMLLAGAALRPLADRRVLFVGLCGAIDASLRNLFATAVIDDLTRFANQLPRHRIDDLYPLFFLIGASAGVARGLLDHVVADRPIRTREEATVPGRRRDHTRVPHRAGAGMSFPLSANPMV